ncbi:unnamed protein product [Candida verbasci]|uniref:Palmitoyltransferase n=1 Tax=Candida verbasci TaxID=1227364 RepID=A0A9W4X881_9ASCO|nr:unnamed protein product [Candida verbasci]
MIFKFILLLTIICTILAIIILFGDSPSLRNTIIQKFRIRLLQLSGKLFTGYEKLDKRLDGRLLYYLNWLVPIGYIIVITTCFHFFFMFSYPLLDPSYLTQFAIFSIILSVYISTFLTIFTNPGETKDEKLMKTYPYHPNSLIFFNGQVCHTCNLVKPARSKHCSVCNSCFLLFDHHCIWVNNCIGLRNYKFFLMFLFTNIAMLTYGGYICFNILYSQTSISHFWNLITRTDEANKVTGTFLLLCCIFTLLASAFTILNLRYIYLGVTTNEVSKWENINYLIDLGLLNKISRSIDNEQYAEEFNLKGEIIYISLKDDRILIDKNNRHEYDIQKVESIEEIDNVYDNGFWNNLKERIFI